MRSIFSVALRFLTGRGRKASRAELLLEWQKTEDLATGFNDLIMKLRTFALPFIATAVAAGSAFGAQTQAIHAPWWSTAVPAAASSVIFLLGAFLLLNFDLRSSRLSVSFVEYACILGLSGSLAAWAGIIVYEAPDSFLFPAPIAAFGGVILFSIYLLDRFYYTSLLVGAVRRAEQLEQTLGLGLSNEITASTPAWTYTLLPTVLHLTPALVLVNIGLAAAAFTEAR